MAKYSDIYPLPAPRHQGASELRLKAHKSSHGPQIAPGRVIREVGQQAWELPNGKGWDYFVLNSHMF